MHRTIVWSLLLLVPLPAAWSQEDKKAEEKKAEDKGTKIAGKLSPDDPKDKALGKPHKVHEIKMVAGKTYQIDLVSRDFDSYLRLEDKAGKQLAQDDDGGGFPNARIMFKAPKDGMYRVIATTFDAKTGAYALTVKVASETAVAAKTAFTAAMTDFQRSYFPALQMVMKNFREAKTEAEGDKLLDKFSEAMEKHADRLAKVAKDFPGEPDGRQAANFAQRIRQMLPGIKGQIISSVGAALRDDYEKAYQAKAKNADDLYKKAETFFSEGVKKYASNAMIASELKDGLFLLEKLSIGKAAPEIEAEDLDGKSFKLSDYRGKVVVLDFWGNW